MKEGSNLNGYTAPTNHVESFFNEDRRWASQSIVDTVANNQTDYTYWINSSNADYNSQQNIADTKDLQQTYQGRLRYPSESYSETSLPNTVDYSSAGGDRFYYRAFQLPTFANSTKQFFINVYGVFDSSSANPASGNDIFSTFGVESTNIQILMRLPGPFDGTNPNTTPGSFWGVVNIQDSPGGEDTTGDGGIWQAFDSKTNIDGGVRFRINTINKGLGYTDGVFILGIRYKAGLDKSKYISKIEIENV